MFRVVFTQRSRDELKELGDYIALRESRRAAAKYLKRLKNFCKDFAIAPHRGERRDGIAFGQRTIGFERRVSVIFEVQDAEQVINIVGIRYAGQRLNQNDL